MERVNLLLATLIGHFLGMLKVLELIFQFFQLLLKWRCSAFVLLSVFGMGSGCQLSFEGSDLFAICFDCFLKLFFFFLLLLRLLLEMDNFFAKLHDFMVEFFLLFVAITVLFLLI